MSRRRAAAQRRAECQVASAASCTARSSGSGASGGGAKPALAQLALGQSGLRAGPASEEDEKAASGLMAASPVADRAMVRRRVERRVGVGAARRDQSIARSIGIRTSPGSRSTQA